MQIIKPDLILLPTPFQLIADFIILFLIINFFIKEQINNFKKKKEQLVKRKNDIKRRLEKANRQYYKKFNRLP